MNYSSNHVGNIVPIMGGLIDCDNDLNTGQRLLLAKLLNQFNNQIINNTLQLKHLASDSGQCIIAPASKEG